MPDNVKTETAKKQTQTVAKPAKDNNNKISLVEMIMILMLVGLVFVFFFGMRQLKVDKANEALAQTKFEAIVPTFEKIVAGMENYRKADEFGDYPAFLDELNLGTIDTPDFKFEYVFDTLSITAKSQAAFGKADIVVTYNLKDKVYSVVDPSPDTKPTVKDEWLPQD